MSLSTPPPCKRPFQNQGMWGPLCSSAARAAAGECDALAGEARRVFGVEAVFVDRVGDFGLDPARDEIAPRAAAYDRSGDFPWDNVKAINQMGLNAIFIPEAYGVCVHRQACHGKTDGAWPWVRMKACTAWPTFSVDFLGRHYRLVTELWPSGAATASVRLRFAFGGDPQCALGCNASRGCCSRSW